MLDRNDGGLKSDLSPAPREASHRGGSEAVEWTEVGMRDRGVHRRDLGNPRCGAELGGEGRGGKDEIPTRQHGVPEGMWAEDEMVGAVSPWMEMEGRWFKTEEE